MSSMPDTVALEEKGDHALRRRRVLWIWPAGARGVLAAMVIAAALLLAVAEGGVNPSPGAALVAAPTLRVDPNTAPPQVLGALPRLGPALVRQLIEAREHQPFRSLEDARRRVRGLGPATLELIAPHVRLEHASLPPIDRPASTPVDRAAGRSRAAQRKKSRSKAPAATSVQPQLAARAPDPAAR
jgi:competence protein ComEA